MADFRIIEVTGILERLVFRADGISMIIRTRTGLRLVDA